MQRLIVGRQALFTDKITYRTQLDQFKMQLGMPPDMPLVVDMSLAQPFYDVFDAVDNGNGTRTGNLDDLPGIIAKIPELEDIDVEGRSVLEPYRNYRSTLTKFLPENEEGLEDLLQSAVRIALEYRMDLMNDRAMLYDNWRQIRVTANALKGVLNLALTNNVYTPVASTNPFAFLSQAKQFSLTLNAELPAGSGERAEQLPNRAHQLPAGHGVPSRRRKTISKFSFVMTCVRFTWPTSITRSPSGITS